MDWFVWWGNRLLGVHGRGGYCIYYPVGKQEASSVGQRLDVQTRFVDLWVRNEVGGTDDCSKLDFAIS